MIASLRRDHRGTAAIEFALIAPVLLAIMAGILEYGRVVAGRQAIRDVLDENARRGVVEVLSSSAIQDAIAADLDQLPIVQDYVVTITDGNYLVVTINATYNLVLGALLPTDMITFQMSNTMRR